MIEFVDGGLGIIATICMGILIITCTIGLVIFIGLLIFGMLDESGLIDFLMESRNNKDRT